MEVELRCKTTGCTYNGTMGVGTNCAGCDEVEILPITAQKEPSCNEVVDREPLRIKCGEGEIGVNEGTCDGVPALVLTSDGTGVIGGTIGVEMPRQILPDIELVTITFTKVESVDVFIRALEGIKKHFN